MERKYPHSQLYKFVELDSGILVPVYLFDDLSNSQIQEHFQGELKVSIFKLGKDASVSIRDNGSGIPEEYLHKLFEPFFTLKKNGIGLGLAACYSIIQSHNASVRVESEVNKGTEFVVSFSES